MRRGAIMAAAAVAGVGVLAVELGTAGAAKTRTRTVSCTLALTAQNPPEAPRGSKFGFVRCTRPLGNGVQYDQYTVTPSSQTTGTVSGPFKHYFNTGTVRGTYKLTYTATGSTINYTGRAIYRRGTGRFRRARGSGVLTCTSSDSGLHTACTVKGTIRGI